MTWYTKAEFVECSCQDIKHVLRIGLAQWIKNTELEASESTSGPEVDFQMMLSDYLPWYKRILPAIYYVFGRNRSCYTGADYDSCLITDEKEVDRIIALLQEAKNRWRLRDGP